MPLMSVPPLKEAVLRDLEALARDERVKKALDLALEEVPFAIEEQIHLCEIPAPTFHEERRADEMERRMRAYGLTDVTRDAIGNVIGRRPGTGSGPTVALVAHMDTVFPEGTDVRVKREGNVCRAPGIGDNASGLRALLQVLRCLNAANIETEGDILFVADVQEEGNGDLNGSKALCSGDIHLDGLIAIDGSDLGRVQPMGTASHSWRFIVKGPGGHSWADFGRVPSAVHAVCRATAEIADFEVPSDPRTSFTVGTIQGGQTCTSIGAHCECEVDFRSLDPTEVLRVEARIFKAFEDAVERENRRWNAEGDMRLTLEKQLIGDIPGGMQPGDLPLLQAARAAQKILGIELTNYGSASTDANPAISAGIPATCLAAGGIGRGAHSLEESFVMDRIELGPQLITLTTLAMVGLCGAVKPMLAVRS